MMNIRILGTEKLQQRLKNVVSQDKIEHILDQGAMLIEVDAKRLVRVDTGRLRNSIDTIRQPLIRYIGSSVVYAAAQEFGRPDLPHYGYTPYLRPAARKNKPKILQMVKHELER